ncbi:MAG: hypothetical protein ACXABY_06270 [Candidatus Thorarchaeota archaeon]
MSKRRILILGHPRSGTLYTTVVLRTLGLQVEHERQGKEGSVTGQFWYGDWKLENYDIILHQIRNPLKVIASCTKMRIRNPKVITHLAELSGSKLTPKQAKHKVLRYMVTWLGFVKWVDSICAWRYSVEDMADIFPRLCKEFSLDISTPLPAIPDNVNHLEHRTLNYNDLRKLDKDLAEQIYAKACEYEYE